MPHYGFDFRGEIADAIKIISLDERVIAEIARDVGATRKAILFIFISILSSHIGLLLFYPHYVGFASPLGLFSSVAMGLFFTVFFIWITSLVAERLFKGKASYDEFLRVMGYASFVGILNIVPEFSLISGIIYLIVMVKVLRFLYGLHSLSTVLTMTIMFAMIGVFMWFFGFNSFHL